MEGTSGLRERANHRWQVPQDPEVHQSLFNSGWLNPPSQKDARLPSQGRRQKSTPWESLSLWRPPCVVKGSFVT